MLLYMAETMSILRFNCNFSQIIQRISAGFRPVIPLLRGGAKPVSDRPVSLPAVADHVPVAILNTNLVLDKDLTHKHHALCRDIRLVRVANTHVNSVPDIHKLHLRSRRVWLGIIDSSSPNRLLECDAHAALHAWEQLLTSTPFSLSMSPPTPIEVSATADAMASKNLAGLGGAAFFPDGSCVWFQFQITLEEASTHWAWVDQDMQKHIGAWELLAQYALTYCIEATLPSCRNVVSCIQGSDNSAADAASAKGLSMTPATACVLAPFFAFMRRCQIYPKITHIPGHLNDIADGLSRFKQPLPEPLSRSNLRCGGRACLILPKSS
jgi:hypothetical protein